MAVDGSTYRGRFAPTPSGPLHFGSILAALGSFLDAKAARGEWLLRMDDLDRARTVPEADTGILKTLERLGLLWDGEVLYQQQRREAYAEALHALQEKALLFPCYCPRKRVKGRPYPGTCRNRKKIPGRQFSTRIISPTGIIRVEDRIQPAFSQELAEEHGDFIVSRADGVTAYHLAVVVDDAFQGITHSVRGADLLDSCPRQIYLQQCLDLPTPSYAHLPVAVSSTGEKLSKQKMAEDSLIRENPATILYAALEFLGQSPDAALLSAGISDIVNWATAHWDITRVPRIASRPVPALRSRQ